MITVISRPEGHKLNPSVLDAVVSDSSGDALFTTSFTHAFTTGDFIYIQSDVESYNGFKYVEVTSTTEFKIRDSSASDIISFKRAVDVTYQISILDHGYIAVHQPIVYELYSNLFPINEPEISYFNNSVVSASDDNGYTQITLDESLTDPVALSWIQIGDNVYQIITVNSPSDVIINLAYDVDNDLTGAVTKYYNNYCINVIVKCGLPSTHPHVSVKPYETSAVLQFVPDDIGHVKFSISEIVRSYITTRNNLALDTLPNNLDFFTAFYIEYYESYDVSDGENITTFEDTATTDQIEFEGGAVNASMPFKSQAVSHMNDYIDEDVYLAKWLVLQTRPLGIIGKFHDISFINRHRGSDITIFQNGVLYQTIINPGIGVLRIPLEWTTAGEYCYQAVAGDAPEIPGEEILQADFPALMTWANNSSGKDWVTGSTPDIDLTFADNTSKRLRSPEYAFIVGATYRIDVQFTSDVISGTSSSIFNRIILRVEDNALSVAFSSFTDLEDFNWAAVQQLSFVANSQCKRVTIQIIRPGDDPYNTTSEIQSALLYLITEAIPGEPGGTITELLCMDVIDECDDTIIPDTDNLRLLETGEGNFRELE